MLHPVVKTCRALLDKYPDLHERAKEVRVRLHDIRVVRAEGVDGQPGELCVVKARVSSNPKATKPEPYILQMDFKGRTRLCTCPAHSNFKGPCKHVLALSMALLEVFELLQG